MGCSCCVTFFKQNFLHGFEEKKLSELFRKDL